METIILGAIIAAVLVIARKWSQSEKEDLKSMKKYPDGFDPEGIYCRACGEKHNPFFKCDEDYRRIYR